MSRLIVKNLPSYVTPARLREHFETKGCPPGTITDFKVALKPDGTSRRFGFVGYKTEEEASTAKEWFDRTFVDSTRISVNIVEVCRALHSRIIVNISCQGAKDAPTPRPNKRPRLGPSPQNIPPPEEALRPKSTSQLDEFLEVMQPRTKKGPAWANDMKQEDAVVAVKPKHKQEVAGEVDTGAGGDDPALRLALSDQEWMKQHMSKNVDVVEKVFEQSDGEDDPVELVCRFLFMRILTLKRASKGCQFTSSRP